MMARLCWPSLATALALSTALSFTGACSTTGTSRPSNLASDQSPPAVGAAAERIMVTFALAPQAMWKRAVDELVDNYELEVLFRWPLESLQQECVVFGLPDNRTAQEIVARVQKDPRVLLAQPIHQFRVLERLSDPANSSRAAASGPAGYNDPHSHLQHGFVTTHIEEAHAKASGRGVKIAVIDTGIDVTHPDLEGRVSKVKNFVEHDETFTADVHGTAVAGVIAAGANNQRGIVGVAPGAELFALKACWQDPPASRSAICDSYTLAQAVDFAINEGAQVVNFSLTGPHDPLLEVLIDKAIERNIVVLAAADDSPHGGFPASHQAVLAVRGGGLARAVRGATPLGERALAAPSEDILSTAPSNSYDFFSGSSLAVAQVSGVAALLLERDPELKPSELVALIRQTAQPVDSEDSSAGVPMALLDAGAALAAATARH